MPPEAIPAAARLDARRSPLADGVVVIRGRKDELPRLELNLVRRHQSVPRHSRRAVVMPHDNAVRPLARVARPHPARNLGADSVARRRKGRVDAARGAVLADDRLVVHRGEHELPRRELHLVRRHPALRRAALCGRREVGSHDDSRSPLMSDQALHPCPFPEA
eukprot:CAMPEP_0185352332 /NCGR_PEP_ID=MMETSP1364-20130426/3916_1 /TAXON_ID=38817 /ORGANISM="Gephyrocapsa oceanica, Strain RCC1303" /LENGTH=162 /DNA_ID=CAMNT_0027951907 /DNA_START=257 /DNA_END=742 /DNA_ORIENTATION=+